MSDPQSNLTDELMETNEVCVGKEQNYLELVRTRF